MPQWLLTNNTILYAISCRHYSQTIKGGGGGDILQAQKKNTNVPIMVKQAKRLMIPHYIPLCLNPLLNRMLCYTDIQQFSFAGDVATCHCCSSPTAIPAVTYKCVV